MTESIISVLKQQGNDEEGGDQVTTNACSLAPLASNVYTDDTLCEVHLPRSSTASIFCVTSFIENDGVQKQRSNSEKKRDTVSPDGRERAHSICWDEDSIKENNTGASSRSYDNKAFTEVDEDKHNNDVAQVSSQTASNSDETIKKSPTHMFVASGIEINHHEESATSSVSSNGKEGSNGQKDCTLSEIDIHRLATTTPNGRERADSLKNWLKDQTMMASVTTMSTIVDETTDSQCASSSKTVVCMNTAGPSKPSGIEDDKNKSSTDKPGVVRMDSTVSGSSMWSGEGRGCRICWNSEEKEKFVQPCLCSGSSANVHISCLKKWLQVTNQFKCEVCNYEYRSSSAFKPISKWSWKCSKTRYLSQLEATMILLGIVTPPLICGIVLCSQKIVEYIDYPEHAWKTAGSFAALMTLVIASSLTYLTALIYFCRKFSAVCRQWMQTNQSTVVRLGDEEAVIEQTREIQQSRDDLIDMEMYSVWSIT